MHRTFGLWTAVTLLAPAAMGGLITWSWWGAVTAFFWASLVRLALLHHLTWSVNSVCHMVGERPFAARDRSANFWPLAILSMGESWHNLHREYTVATAQRREAQLIAAEKAAAAARTEAERARKASDAAGRRKREEAAGDGATVPYTGPIPASCNAYQGNRKTGCALLLASGFGLDQMPCLDKLWTKESGWNHKARNPSSGAYGIPQAYPGGKMASAGADWQTNPATQIKWGLDYIKKRYDDPCGAWQHSEETGSY